MTSTTPTSTSESTELAGMVQTLKDMTAVGARDRLWLRRQKNISIQYEFVDDTAEGGVHVYHSAVRGTDWSFRVGALPDDECDVVLRTTPRVLRDVLSGVTGGREAMLSGQLMMRKAPSHPKLLLMRAIFNRYTKSVERGELVDLHAPAETD